MKRSFLLKNFLGIVLGLSPLVISLAWGNPSEGVPEGTLFHVRGQATIQQAGAAEWAMAFPGDRLMEGDCLRVESDAHIEIFFEAGGLGLVRVEDESEVLIRNLDPVQIRLERGRVIVYRESGGSTLTVATAQAVGGSSEGSFMRGYEPVQQLDTLLVLEGTSFLFPVVEGEDLPSSENALTLHKGEGFVFDPVFARKSPWNLAEPQQVWPEQKRWMQTAVNGMKEHLEAFLHTGEG